MFLLNWAALTIGYIVLGSLVILVVAFAVSYIVHWFKYDESVGKTIDREIDEAIGRVDFTTKDEDGISAQGTLFEAPEPTWRGNTDYLDNPVRSWRRP